MENTGSIVTLAVAALFAGYLGYRINKERNKLREEIGILGERDVPLIDSLEGLVRRGDLVPVAVRGT